MRLLRHAALPCMRALPPFPRYGLWQESWAGGRWARFAQIRHPHGPHWEASARPSSSALPCHALCSQALAAVESLNSSGLFRVGGVATTLTETGGQGRGPDGGLHNPEQAALAPSTVDQQSFSNGCLPNGCPCVCKPLTPHSVLALPAGQQWVSRWQAVGKWQRGCVAFIAGLLVLMPATPSGLYLACQYSYPF